MAGKSFDLLFSRNNLFSDVLAFFYSTFVYFAPWLVVLFYIIWSSRWFSASPFFLSVLSYSLIFSMIIAGGMSFLISRFLANCIYSRDQRKIYESYIGAVLLVFSVSLVIGLIFFAVNNQYSLVQKILACYTFVGFSLVWILMQFSSVTEKESLAVLAFAGGIVVSVLLARFWDISMEEKLLLTLDIGIGLIIFMLNFLILSYLRSSIRIGFDFLLLTRKHPQLLFIGYFYYLSIWIDNFIAWKVKGIEIAPGFFMSPEYDIPKFMASPFFIPSLVVFNLSMETVFQRNYKGLMQSIVSDKPMRVISENLKKLSLSLRHAFSNMFALNMVAMISCFLLRDSLRLWFNLSESFNRIFVWDVVGVSMNIAFMSLLVASLHFEYYGIALEGTALVLTSNMILSVFFIENIPGLSFAVAFSGGFLYLLLRFKSKDFLYEVYTKQPLGLEKVKKTSWKPKEMIR